MGSVHHLPLSAPGLTEAELDTMIEDKRRAQADADRLRAQAAAFRALQAAKHAARAAQTCPPCLGHCEQGDTCQARLSALQQRVQADAQQATPSTRTLVTMAIAVLGAFFVSGLAQRWGWF